MNRDQAHNQSFLNIVNEYFPRDAVQVIEDVRTARDHSTLIRESEASHLIASLCGATVR